MTAEFSIRQMRPTDADGLKKIASLSFSGLMGFFAVHSLFSEEGHVLVSEAKETVVGFAKLINFKISGSKFGCILWIAVQPDFRGKGVATALTVEGLLNLKRDGAKAVFASSQRRNAAGLNVLIRNGFRRMSFPELWRFFGWRVFQFYKDIWLAPGEVVLMHD